VQTLAAFFIAKIIENKKLLALTPIAYLNFHCVMANKFLGAGQTASNFCGRGFLSNNPVGRKFA